MIPHTELAEIKERLLVAAAATRAMVESPGQPFIRFDEHQYMRVQMAFWSLHDDATKLLAELDTLRHMFADRVNEFINGGLVDAIGRDAGNGGSDLAAVPAPQDVGGGEGLRVDDTADSGPAPAKRTRRGRKPRSVKAGDTGGVSGDSPAVDARANEEPVGGQETP